MLDVMWIIISRILEENIAIAKIYFLFYGWIQMKKENFLFETRAEN